MKSMNMHVSSVVHASSVDSPHGSNTPATLPHLPQVLLLSGCLPKVAGWQTMKHLLV